MVSYKIIGQHIKAARQRLDINQAEAAHRCGISTAYYGKFERGDQKPNIDMLGKISQGLGVPFEGLFIGALIPEAGLNENVPIPAEEYEVFMNELGSLTDERTKLVLMRLCADVRSLLAKPEDKAE